MGTKRSANSLADAVAKWSLSNNVSFHVSRSSLVGLPFSLFQTGG